MTQANRIRRHVLERHVGPARTAGKVELTVRASEVCDALGLQGRAPNVCSVLGSRKLLDLAGLRFLDRVGPRQSTTTTFRYALVEPPDGAVALPTPVGKPPENSPMERWTAATPRRRRGGSDKLTVVIACAGTKSAAAGQLTLPNGRPGQVRRQSAGGAKEGVDGLQAPGRNGAFGQDVETGARRVQPEPGGKPARSAPGLDALRAPEPSEGLHGSGRGIRTGERLHPVCGLGPRRGGVPVARLRHHIHG